MAEAGQAPVGTAVISGWLTEGLGMRLTQSIDLYWSIPLPPFSVLKPALYKVVHYLDVSDHRHLPPPQSPRCSNDAAEAGVTAIINTGIFPGIFQQRNCHKG